jgi:hypothetical protein
MKKTYFSKLAVTVGCGFATFLYIRNMILIENYCDKLLLIQLGWPMCGFENQVSSLK